MKPDTLIAPGGAYDRAAIMHDAHRQRRQMARHGWTWPRLAFAWSKARAQRARMTVDPDRVERVMVPPTPEGIAAMWTALTGRNPSAEETARLARRLAAREQ